MKRIFILTAICLLGVNVLADEVNVPAQSFNDNRAAIGIQKQPAKENKQEVKNNWFCIVVQVNGKRERAESEGLSAK